MRKEVRKKEHEIRIRKVIDKWAKEYTYQPSELYSTPTKTVSRMNSREYDKICD